MNETQLEKIEIPAAGEAKVTLPERITTAENEGSSSGMRILQVLPPVWGKIWTVCLPVAGVKAKHYEVPADVTEGSSFIA